METAVTKPFKKHHKHHKAPPLPPPPPPEPPPPPPPPPEIPQRPTHPFLFPKAQSTVLPDPSLFFSPHLLSSPLPTNSFFQNFVLKNGDQPEYIHPYLIKSSLSSLSLCYPSQFSNSSFVCQIFNPDITISTLHNPDPNSSHIVSSFDDLSLTLDLPTSNLKFFLVRGSPYLTCVTTRSISLSISTIHAILECSSNTSLTKYTIKLNNNQTWLLYTSSPITLSHNDVSSITSGEFCGIVRIGILPDSNPRYEPILDQFSHCYPVSGKAMIAKPFVFEYKWEKKGWGDLLMLAHPLHLQLLSKNDCQVSILGEFKYKSIDGDLVGVVADSWVLKTDSISLTWHSISGVKEDSYPELIDALKKDVAALNSTPISTSSCYSYGKLIARAARLALIAEEVCCAEVIPDITKFLKGAIEPWLDGTFVENGFVYEEKWGGIVTKQGLLDSGADFGFGIYNNHHYQLGYFLYAISVLAKIDLSWGRKYKPQAYSLMADFMNLGRKENSKYPRLRCFDMWTLHSWAGGLTEFADGRNQESASEAINAYYSLALMGLAYGDTHLVSASSTLVAMEIHSAQTWWHVKEENGFYSQDFIKENRLVGVLWANKRDSGLWFGPSDWRECRVEIQVLPLLPITENLFSDSGFAKELVKWVTPSLGRGGSGEGWKGFVYALQGVYDKEGALCNIRNLRGFDDGNSISNLLWWVHSRDDDEEGYEGGGKLSWFGHYCH